MTAHNLLWNRSLFAALITLIPCGLTSADQQVVIQKAIIEVEALTTEDVNLCELRFVDASMLKNVYREFAALATNRTFAISRDSRPELVIMSAAE